MILIILQHEYPLALIRKRDRGPYLKSLEKAQVGGSMEDYLKIIAAAWIGLSVSTFRLSVLMNPKWRIHPACSGSVIWPNKRERSTPHYGAG